MCLLGLIRIQCFPRLKLTVVVKSFGVIPSLKWMRDFLQQGELKKLDCGFVEKVAMLGAWTPNFEVCHLIYHPIHLVDLCEVVGW